MSYGNLRSRPDLSPLFGLIGKENNDRILDLLLQIDVRLDSLAQEATRHIGVPYRNTGLGFFAGAAGAEIAGGPYGDAGDIWFEIQMLFDQSTDKSHAPPWIVESQIIVFCVDPSEANSCTHVLTGIVTQTNTPISAVEALASHVDVLRSELLRRKASEFTGSFHASLVDMSSRSIPPR